MPGSPPLAPRPAPRSVVVLRPIGYFEAGALLLGVVLVGAAATGLVLSCSPGRTGAAGLLGLGLVLWAGRILVRGTRPLLLTIGRADLHLEPLGPARGQPTETVLLSSIVAYTYWVRLLKYRPAGQCHLRLELADGRVLHLADRPGTRPDDPAGTVRLDVLAQRLARRIASGLRRRKLFYLTQPARVLLWASWALLAVALLLLWLGHPAAALLLYPAVGYWASYYLGRRAAELAELPQEPHPLAREP